MSVRRRKRFFGSAVLVAVFGVSPVVAVAQTGPTFKVAYYNIQAGKGEPALPGHPATFTDSGNCSNPGQPMNAWGVGLVQSHLVSSLGNDARVVALGLGEAWGTLCGSPENVRTALGWKAHTSERNGVAMVARHGFAGPEEWVQLDTTMNPTPGDTMWVLRRAVCLDAVCSANVDVFVAHWMGADVPGSLDRQGLQTIEFLRSRGGTSPHVLVGDLNAWEGSPVCSQIPDSGGLSHLRAAGYIDAWPAVHGNAEGFTGMVNRGTCGIPMGYPFKRIDYAWTPPGFYPVSIERFGMVPPGDGAPSDHYGIVAEYPWPTAPPPPGITPDIVLYTKDASVTAGSWRLEDDPSAAGGRRMTQPDAGAPKIISPLAAPGHYFELNFTAQAGVGYRLWLRGNAAQNYWLNDSIYVQFSGSVTASGTPIWRIGTASAMTVILEECGGCSMNGWGWQDNGYGLNVLGPLVYFAASGPQTIRIQAREDGLSLDQIVLSSSAYLNRAPGPAAGDHTILPSTGQVPAVDETEIVMRAQDAVRIAGAWRFVPDSTAAGGMAITHPNAGAPKILSPLPAPADFVEFTFQADGGRPYRLWLRGRADNDLWSNDSVFVQFSGAVSSTGAPVYRIGSDTATSVNLEEASNVGVAGWGWQDNGYGLGVLGPPIVFAATGPQTIRIQTREDGLRFDQIVLSSRNYLSSAPGASKNDATIIPR